MVKEIRQRNEQVKPNERGLRVLRENFPGCFRADGTFDLVRFQEAIKETTDVVSEGYELKFLGKEYAKMLAALDTETVLVPDEEQNAQPENVASGNIYLSGDNLDGLKHLLKSYAHSVKCIYIDPPYNTGSDGFVYNDTFAFTTAELVQKLGIDEEEAARILDMTTRGSASHSAWLTFMYARLLLARDLLKRDGVIFLSIDENEHSNLQLICNDIFGEENFAGEIIWCNSSKNDQAYISIQHEYILAYVRDKSVNIGDWTEKKEGTDEIFRAFDKFHKEYGDDWEKIHQAALKWYKQFPPSNPIYDSKHYSYMDDVKGVYFPSDISGPNYGQYRYELLHPITHKPCKEPASGWRFPKEKMDMLVQKRMIQFGENETTVPKNKTYLIDTLEQGLTSIKYKDGRVASKQLAKLFDGNFMFSNPKDAELLGKLFEAVHIDDGDIVCDFFGGSSTTAEAVFQLAIAKKERIRCLVVQSQDNLDQLLFRVTGSAKNIIKNEIHLCEMKEVPHTLDEIGMERIRRAAKKLRAAHPETQADLGFRHYTLSAASQDTLDKLDAFDPTRDADMFVKDNWLAKFGKETVLATWLVRDHYGFAKPEVLDFAGYPAYFMQHHLYLLDEGLSEEAMEALLVRYETDGTFNPENLVLFGYSFTFDERASLDINVRRLKDTGKSLAVHIDVRY